MTAIRPREVVTALVTIVVAIGLWEAVVRLFNVPEFLVPAPSAIWQEFAGRPDLYATHTWITLYETVIDFLLPTLLGIGATIAIVSSRAWQSVVYPVNLVLQIVPKVAIAPLLLIWVG